MACRGTFLILCPNEIADVCTLLFQASLEQGILPSDWKRANIVPVYKKGDIGRVESYRPISLTSVSSLEFSKAFGKVDHKILLKKLSSSANGYNHS